KEQMPRVMFAVRVREGGEPGSFATFLPVDHGGLPANPVSVTSTVRIVRGAPERNATQLARAMASLRDGTSAQLRVTLVAADDAPLEIVLAAAEAVHRGGADVLEFGFLTPGEQGPVSGEWGFDTAERGAFPLPNSSGVTVSPPRG